MTARFDPLAAELPERVLAAIAKATSQHPARADAVRARTGADEAAFAAAIEQLAAERRLNCAWIQKAGDAEPWLAIWPTGLPAKSAAWTNGSHGALFVTHRPNDLYQAHAPRSTPPAAPEPATESEPNNMETTRKNPPLRENFVALLARLDCAITLSAAAVKLGSTKEALRHHARALVKQGAIVETAIISDGRGETAYCSPQFIAGDSEDAAKADASPVVDDIAAAVAAMEPEPEMAPPAALYGAGDLTVTEIPAVAAAAPAAPAAPDTPAPEHVVRIALWDDGTLTIADGDDILQYGPDVTRRLALLLGVPGATLPARSPMPPLPQLIGSPAVAGA